ncbi:MAG: hypothetical protein NT084_06800 [Bacteroidetes bacterium]|nr:hypothetical protein [Bacteroidota bacterium]
MRIFLPLLSLALTFSCSSGTSDKTNQDSATTQLVTVLDLKAGTFIQLSCANDASNSYEVYLPIGFNKTDKYKVVIFFDAHGNGHLPLEKYKSLADNYNYIFVGSNSSKNGLDMNTALQIGNGLIIDVENRLPYIHGEVVLCGFSGGARTAAALGQNQSDLKGIICNSAAPQTALPGKVFVGLAGLGDMNYLEMRKHEDVLSGSIFPHELIVFDGKHEWAPVSVMEDALLITGAFVPTTNHATDDTLMASILCKKILHDVDSIKKISCLLTNNLLETGLHCAKGGKFESAMQKKHDAVSKDACVKSDEAAWKSAEAQESQLQQELGSAIMQQDTTWWKANESKYFETTKTGAEKFMRQRLRGYASLMCYSYANQAFKTHNLHAAEKLVSIYSIVDPTNSEWAYMRAQLYIEIGMKDVALSALEKAVELGFNDQLRLQNDPAFLSLQSDARFAALYGKMK